MKRNAMQILMLGVLLMGAPQILAANKIEIAPSSSDSSVAHQLTDARVGEYYSLQFTIVKGPTNPRYSILGLTQPPSGLTLEPNGLLHGTPTAAFDSSTSFPFAVMVVDLVPLPPQCWITSLYTYMLNVLPPRLQVNAPDVIDVEEEVPFSMMLVSSQGVAPVRWSAIGLPTELTLEAGGELFGTLPCGYGRTHGSKLSVTIELEDSATPINARGTKSVTIKVLPATNESLVQIQAPPTLQLEMGKAFSSTVGSLGGVGPFAWSWRNTPPWMYMKPDNDRILIVGFVPHTAASHYRIDLELSTSCALLPNDFVQIDIFVGKPQLIPELRILNAWVPEGRENEAFTDTTLKASGGAPPYSWGTTNLPSGLKLQVVNGEARILGSLAQDTAGVHEVGITLVDANGTTASTTLWMVVAKAMEGYRPPEVESIGTLELAEQGAGCTLGQRHFARLIALCAFYLLSVLLTISLSRRESPKV